MEKYRISRAMRFFFLFGNDYLDRDPAYRVWMRTLAPVCTRGIFPLCRIDRDLPGDLFSNMLFPGKKP